MLHHGRRRHLHGVDQRPLDLGPGGGAAGVHHTSVGVAAFPCELQGAVGVAVEHGAEGDEFVDATRAFVDEHADGIDVAQAGARLQGVGQVEVGRVRILREHGGHPALGPPGRRLHELGLRQDPQAQPRFGGGAHGRREAGDPTSQY